eukprot:bmy_08753T0
MMCDVFKFDLGLKEKELCPPMPASMLFFVRGDRAWRQWTASRSEGDSVADSVHGKPSVVYRFFTSIGQVYQAWLDKSTPYTAVRWVVTLGLSFIYMIRVYLLPGWYIVTYALGIHHLNILIAFLSPKVDPSLMEDSDDGPSLPTKQNEAFQSSIRRLPEFKSWHAVTKGILVAMVCTFFEAFNVPVFWPILVMYFIMLFHYHDEEANKAHDRVPVHPVHARQEDTQGEGGHGQDVCQLDAAALRGPWTATSCCDGAFFPHIK